MLGALAFKLDAARNVLRHIVVRKILGRPMAYDQNNIFAKILRGELPAYKVYEDDKSLAFLDIMPRAPGHTLVLPKAPARNILDVAPDDLAHVTGGVRGSYQHNQSDFEFVKALAKVVPDI